MKHEINYNVLTNFLCENEWFDFKYWQTWANTII